MENENDEYIEYCNSSSYIKRWIKLGKSKEVAIKIGVKEHLEDLEEEIKRLKTQLDYMS